jgi:hypothetical protein
MLDKTSKKVIKFLKSQPDCTYMYFNDLPEDFPIDETAFFASIRYLENNGFVETVHSQEGTSLGICLSHTGLHKREFNFIAVKIFFINNLIAILALILSIVAFIRTF